VLFHQVHQDNTPVHTSSQALTAIRNAGYKLLSHPSYSPDLVPSDFYLFPKLKEFKKCGKLPMTVMLSAPRVTGWRTKIKNSSIMEYGLWRIAGVLDQAGHPKT